MRKLSATSYLPLIFMILYSVCFICAHWRAFKNVCDGTEKKRVIAAHKLCIHDTETRGSDVITSRWIWTNTGVNTWDQKNKTGSYLVNFLWSYFTVPVPQTAERKHWKRQITFQSCFHKCFRLFRPAQKRIPLCSVFNPSNKMTLLLVNFRCPWCVSVWGWFGNRVFGSV